MTRKVLDRLINDAGLTPDALRITLYVERLGAGWQRIKQPALRVLLNGRGEKPIRTAYENAGERGWLDVACKGGQGGAWYRFRTPEETPEETERWRALLANASPQGVNDDGNGSGSGGVHTLNDSQTGGIRPETANDSPGGGIQAAPSPPAPPLPLQGESSVLETTTTTPATRGSRAWLAGVMGVHAAAAMARIDAMSGAEDDWPEDLWAFYRPPDPARPTDGGGTQWGTIAQIPAERLGAVVANALTDFARSNRFFNGRGLRAFIEGAVREEQQRTGPRQGRPPSSGYTRPGRQPIDETPAGFEPTERFTGFNA